MADVKYPDITVVLVGKDGNAFAILGRMRAAMKRAEVLQIEIDRFMDETKSGDYDHLLQTCMEWVNVE